MRNLGASAYDRLLKLSKSSNRPMQELLLYYAMERFLARVASSDDKDIFVLKGALILNILDSKLARPTRDIDFLGHFSNDHKETAGRIRKICSIDLGDGAIFDGNKISVEKIKEDADYEGVRVSFGAKIHTAKVPIQIDIGFGDAITPAPKKMNYPLLLSDKAFALRSYPKETIVAEKCEAMVKLAMANSRMKDFFDIWFLARGFEFEGPLLMKATATTFARRGTEISSDPPIALTPDFWNDSMKIAQWTGFARRLNIGVPIELPEVGVFVEKFLRPVLMAISDAASFDKTWKPGGPWV